MSENVAQSHPPTRPRARNAGAKRWRVFSRGATIAQLLAVVIVMGTVVHEFNIERPKERTIREAQLHASIAHLLSLEDRTTAHLSVHKIMKLLRDDERDMTGIAVPGVFLRMAEFEEAVWSDVHMNGTEFLCNSRAIGQLSPFYEGTEKPPPCARLFGVNFENAQLNDSVFHLADLREGQFSNARLNRASITGSLVTGADFSGARLFGIEILESDFTDTEFARAPSFECDPEDTRQCPELRWVSFRNSTMSAPRFFGAEIVLVDFSHADLRNGGFACHDRNPDNECTYLHSVCFRHARLDGVLFEDVEIVNSDFSGASLTGAEFENVHFEDVVFPTHQAADATFDDDSASSLEQARLKKLEGRDVERLCTTEWRRSLFPWRSLLDWPNRVSSYSHRRVAPSRFEPYSQENLSTEKGKKPATPGGPHRRKRQPAGRESKRSVGAARSTPQS